MKKIAIYVHEEQLRELKSRLALKKNGSFSKWVREAVEKELKKQK